MRTLILSDLHLGARTCNVPLLAEVLEREPFDRLIVNGDTLHHLNFRKFTPAHWAMLNRLRQIGKERELILLRGNHDHDADYLPGSTKDELTSASILPGILGLPMREECQLQVNGQQYQVLHGDRFDPSMAHPLLADMGFLAYQFTTKINKKLAKWLKKSSKKWGGLAEIVRTNAIAHAQKANTPGILIGHTHLAEDLHVGGIHYLNSGAWTESPCSYLTADAKEITLHRLSD